jgi:hypothetical protein
MNHGSSRRRRRIHVPDRARTRVMEEGRDVEADGRCGVHVRQPGGRVLQRTVWRDYGR